MRADRGQARGRLRLLLLVLPVLGVLLPVGAARAAEVTLTGRALLAGHVRPGAWMAVAVTVENAGPPISGELRLGSEAEGRSSYGTPVELATGARQEHVLYAQPGFFGRSLRVQLWDGAEALATTAIEIRSHDAYQPIIGIVAEHPEGLHADIVDAATAPNVTVPAIVPLTPADLPARVEAWSAIDRLVWQDVDIASSLSGEQLQAMTTWLGAGGRLIVVGGTAGSGVLAGFPTGLLPFRPAATVDVASDELASLLGPLPAGVTGLAAVAGTLERGSVLARTGDQVFAAESDYGQGVVTVVGVNLADPALRGTEVAKAFWGRLLPPSVSAVLNPLVLPDDSTILAALNNLPSIDLPRIDQLFLLLFGYIALVGPVNYLVLRRLDRREWAWLTMPLLVVGFSVAAYSLGLLLKGSDIVVNEVAIVRGATGTETGLGQVYVGVYSPTRQTFDVRVRGGALLSNPTVLQQQGRTEQQPLDILFGDPSRLRNFGVGYAALRSFRAESALGTPRIETDFRYVDGRLQGSLTNRSETTLEHVAVSYGGGLAVIRSLAPGEGRAVDIAVADAPPLQEAYSVRVFGHAVVSDPAEARRIATRRAVLDQLSGFGPGLAGAGTGQPTILAWRSGSSLEIDVGQTANRVGEALYLLSAPIRTEGRLVYTSDLMRRSVIAADAGQAFFDGYSFNLSRGTMTVELRPVSAPSAIRVTSLELALTQGEPRVLRGRGTAVDPLPDAEQPDQADPVGDAGASGEEPALGEGGIVGGGKPVEGFTGIPALQLFDRVSGRWLEFPKVNPSASHVINDPARFVDEAGAVRIRFVNRGALEEQAYFNVLVRLEGSAA